MTEEQRLVAVLSLQKQALESTRKCPFACSFSDLQHTPIDMLFFFKIDCTECSGGRIEAVPPFPALQNTISCAKIC